MPTHELKFLKALRRVLVLAKIVIATSAFVLQMTVLLWAISAGKNYKLQLTAHSNNKSV